MNDFYPVLGVTTALPAVDLASPGFPEIDSPNVEGDYLLSLLNVGALEAAMAGLNEEVIRNTAAVLSTLAYALKRYIDLGKVPVRVQHIEVVGVLTDGNWIFFMPWAGVVMRCNSSMAVGSQSFEVLASYLASAEGWIGSPPWWDRTSVLGTTMDGLAPPVPPFWTLHMKTAEVI